MTTAGCGIRGLTRRRSAAIGVALAVVLAVGDCTDAMPSKPKASGAIAAPTVVLTNFLSGPGTWRWKIKHINPPYVWYLVASYSGGGTVITQVGQGDQGAFEALDPLKSVSIEAVWCFKPREQDHNLCGEAIVDADSGQYTDQIVGLDPENPYYQGPGDDFVVEFTLPPSCPAGAACVSPLTVKADHPKYIVGETGEFQAFVNGNPVASVKGWSWDGQPVPECGTSCICNYKLAASGSMSVSAVVAGKTETGSVSVSVSPLNCPTGDPLLDDPKLRRALVRAVDLGQGLNSDFSKWTEYDAAYVGSQFGRTSATLPLVPGADQCHSDFQRPDPNSNEFMGDTLFAIIHVHSGTPNKDAHCPAHPGQLLDQGASKTKDVPSIKKLHDLRDYRKAGWDPPWLIIDNLFVYKDVVGKNGKVQEITYTWNLGSCHWNQF